MRRFTATNTRAKRGEHDRSDARRTKLRFPVAVLALVAVALLVAGFALGRVVFSGASGRMEPVNSPVVSVSGTPASLPSTGSLASGSAGMVEVPELVGMRADSAVVVLETAGFKVAFINVGSAVSSEASRVVQSQQPISGTVLSADATVTIMAPPRVGGVSQLAASRKKNDAPKFVVCIDPGHQAHTDVKLEPIGPGSKTEKPRATGGTTGVATGIPEYEVALQLSMNLKKRLEAAGVKVIMTRTTNDVSLPNSARASIANKAKSDIFIRIHTGISTEPAESGVSTLYPSTNKWTAGIVTPSRAAAKSIEQAVCRSTGAKDRGAQKQAGVAGFNWSKVPSVLVEAGFLSNPLEDQLMASPKYQDKLAQGAAVGVLAYLNGAR